MRSSAKRFAAAFCAVMLTLGAAGCGNTDKETANAPAAAESTAETTAAAESTADNAETDEKTEEKTEDTDKPEEKVESKEDAKEKTEASESKELSVKEAAGNISSTLDEVKKAANGELDGGYTMNMTYTPAADLKEQGVDMKPVSMTIDAKQKDKLTGLDYAISYDSKSVISMNIVVDNENETAYVVIPELSDGVLSASGDDVSKLVEDNMQAPINPIGDENIQADSDVQSPDLDALKDIDYDALTEDLLSYVDTIMENIPEPADGGEYTVSSGSVSIPLTVKSYTVTPEDREKLNKALEDKLNSDETLKSFYKAFGMTDEQYSELWKGAESDAVGEDSETAYFDVYYQGDVPAGIAIKDDKGETQQYAIFASDDTNLIVDCDFGTEGTESTCKGLVTYENNTLNGTIEVYSKTEYSETKGTVEYKDLFVSEDGSSMKGDVIVNVADNGTETASMTMSMDVNEDGGKISYTMSGGGSDIGTVDIVMQNTDASDIKIPEGTIYKMTDEEEMNKYAENCDVEGFKASLKETIGDELYDQLFPDYAAQSQAAADDVEASKTDVGKA